MQHQDVIQRLLKQITEIIELIQQKAGNLSGKIAPEAIPDFNKLKESVALFKAANQKGFRDANIDIGALKNGIQESEVVSEADKLLLEDVNKVQKNLTQVRSLLEKKEKQNAEALESNKEHKQKMKERRKSFKSIGGDKKWIPL